MTTPTLSMLTAVDAVISKAREINPGIPEVTVVLGASGKMRKGQKHGHFAPKSWESRDGEDLDVIEANRMGEVLLAGESLQRGGRATLGTIIHELAHAYCDANDIKDTSNGHRYHNKKFKEVAEDFGLSIERADVIGWSVTDVPDELAEFYADEITALDEAITQYRVTNLEVVTPTKQKKYKMVCEECQDAVQVTKGWIERNEFKVFCQEHGTPFQFFVEETP